MNRTLQTEEILAIISGVYFGMRDPAVNRESWRLAVRMVSSIALAFSLNPERFLHPDDVALLKSNK